jgi:DNA-directed RNA polymerase specialized sigma24 family protein
VHHASLIPESPLVPGLLERQVRADAASAGGESPSLKLGNQEVLEEAVRRMTPEERQIRELFLGQGLAWAEIAAKLGGTAEGRRKQWERARERITGELGQDK